MKGVSAHNKKACVIIPAYNEATVIGEVIQAAAIIFSSVKGYQIDILVVNDGSADTTAAEARKAGATVVSHILNSGAGGATLTGLSYAAMHNYDIAATMDADGQHDPSDVIQGIQQAATMQVDLLIGSRLIDSAGMSRTKVIGNKGLSFITWMLFGVNVTDSQSGLRIYSKKAISSLSWKSSGYEFCSEMIWRAKQNGMSVAEYPIKAIYTDYSMSKGQSNWNAVNIIKRLLKHRIMELLG